MADIDDYESDLNEQLKALESNIETIAKKDPSQKARIISKCQSQCNDITTRIESYELEILYLDKQKAIPYKESLKNIQERFNRAQKDLESKRSETAATNTLMANENFQKNPAEMTSLELIALGRETQQKGSESLTRTLDKVNDANNIADDINAELMKQLAQLENSSNMVKDTKTDIQRANEYIRYFAAEVRKDKIITGMIILIILIIIAIIIIKFAPGVSKSTTLLSPDIILKSRTQQ